MKINPTIEAKLDPMTSNPLVRASTRRFRTPIKVGDYVQVIEPDEHVSFDATVDSIDEYTGRVMVRVDLRSERNDS